MIPGAIKNVDGKALRALIKKRFPESKTLEYKGKVPGKADREIDRVGITVCAFANTAGGHLILGMRAEDGIPVGLKGIETTEIDDKKQWIENKLKDLVEPTLPALDIHAVEITNDEHVLIVDVGESWVAPHRWKKNNHFYRRTSAGNDPLDLQGVRTAFATSEGVTDRIRQFRMERIWRIQSERTPVGLQPGGRMILHMLPRAAFATSAKIDVATLEAQENRISPIGGSGNHRVNLDGFLTYGSWEPGGACAYSQVFRNGAIEAVTALGSNEKGPVLECREYEEDIIQIVSRYLKVADNLKLHPPYFGFLTFVNMKGAEFMVPTRWRLGKQEELLIAQEDTLMMPDIVLDERDVVLGKALKPLFDTVWNTFGFSESYNYNDEGNWEKLRW